MKISKRQLRRIIKEEKAKLVAEANPDGTISADEDERTEDFLMEVEMRVNELMQFIRTESQAIGGGFRGPGLRAQAMKILNRKLGRR